MSNIDHKLDLPFKNFQAGQIIQSKQFNDDMADIEDKVNEIIDKHNNTNNGLKNHIEDVSNPHNVTSEQVGAYDKNKIDEFIESIRNGDLEDKSITNRVLADESVDSRVIKNGSITPSKTTNDFGYLLDISNNIDIIDRYTKDQVDKLLIDRVGDGTYTKEEIDDKLSDIQAGQIVDKTIGVEKLKSDVGERLGISKNPTILNMYTNDEILGLIRQNGLPKDWGSITEDPRIFEFGILPIADFMMADSFITPPSYTLDLSIQEVVNARSTYNDLSARLDKIENSIVAILEMFSGGGK